MSLCKWQRGAKREMDSVSLLTLASKENDSKDGRRSGSAAGLRGAGSEGCWEGAGVGRWLLDYIVDSTQITPKSVRGQRQADALLVL